MRLALSCQFDSPHCEFAILLKYRYAACETHVWDVRFYMFFACCVCTTGSCSDTCLDGCQVHPPSKPCLFVVSPDNSKSGSVISSMRVLVYEMLVASTNRLSSGSHPDIAVMGSLCLPIIVVSLCSASSRSCSAHTEEHPLQQPGPTRPSFADPHKS